MKQPTKSRTISQEYYLLFRSALLCAIDWEEGLADAWSPDTPEHIEAKATAARYRATRDRLFPEHRDAGKVSGDMVSIYELSRKGGTK